MTLSLFSSLNFVNYRNMDITDQNKMKMKKRTACTVATKPPVKRKYAEIGDFHGTRDIRVMHVCSMDLPMDSHEGGRGCFPVVKLTPPPPPPPVVPM